MCSISVEPMPSRMCTPTMSNQRWPTASGSASPAEMQRRRRSDPALGPMRGCASSEAYSVGTPPKIVGLWRCITASTASGVGRSGSSTAAAPTDIGKVRLLPRP